MLAAGNYPLAASPEVEEIAPSPTEGKVLKVSRSERFVLDRYVGKSEIEKPHRLFEARVLKTGTRDSRFAGFDSGH